MRNRIQTISLGLLLALLMCGCTRWLPSSVQVQRGITYAQVGGKPLKLDIYRLRQATGKQPVVVWIHGGGWAHGSKDFCPIGFMAAQNLTIVSVDYRLCGVAPFPAQVNDCKGAIRWLRANADRYRLDAGHIGIFGGSAGGHLGLMLAVTGDGSTLEGDVGGNLNYSSQVQCVCALYPPTDLNRLVDPRYRLKRKGDVANLIGGPAGLNPDKVVAASPVTYVDKNCAPVFLVHGGADKRVPPEQSRLFYDAASKAGVEAHLEILPNRGHGAIPSQQVLDEIYRFFEVHLRGS